MSSRPYLAQRRAQAQMSGGPKSTLSRERQIRSLRRLRCIRRELDHIGHHLPGGLQVERAEVRLAGALVDLFGNGPGRERLARKDGVDADLSLARGDAKRLAADDLARRA